MNTQTPGHNAPEAPAPTPADSHGAIDLSARVATPAPNEAAPTGEGLHIPLITATDEAGFQDVMSTSQAVPVVLVMWSSRSL